METRKKDIKRESEQDSVKAMEGHFGSRRVVVERDSILGPVSQISQIKCRV